MKTTSMETKAAETGAAESNAEPYNPITGLPVEFDEETVAPVRADAAWSAPLRHADFRLLLAGTVFMSAGQWIQQVTLGWLVYDMSGSSVLLGVLNGVRLLPFLILAPPAGVAADRMDRRKLLMSTQALLLVTAVIMGILVMIGKAEVWHLFVFTLITGMAWAFNHPVRQALVPSVVPRDCLAGAVTLSSTGSQFTKLIAPAIGGLLIVWFGAGGNFLVQGATYAGVFAMIYLMRVEPLPKQTVQSSGLADLAEGLKYVASNRPILGLVLVSLVSKVFATPYQTLMPVLQKDVYGVGPEGLGLLMAAPGVGAVVATLLLTSVAGSMRHRGLFLMGSLCLLGILLIAFSTTRSMDAALIALVGVGGSQTFFNVLSLTMLQLLVPDALRGRVISLYMLDHGLTPAGALLAGVATAYVGAPVTVAMMGLCVIALAVVVFWAVPQIRDPKI